MPKSRWFLRIATCAGVLAILAMEAGWVVSEVGRQPWIVYVHMKVEDAATGEHRRLDHLRGGSCSCTSVVAVTTVLVLRGMSRRLPGRAAPPMREMFPYGPRGGRLGVDDGGAGTR